MNAVLFLSAAALAALPAVAAAQTPAPVGSWAPEIEARDWLNDPPGTSLEDLRGRVVFLEYWATW